MTAASHRDIQAEIEAVARAITPRAWEDADMPKRSRESLQAHARANARRAIATLDRHRAAAGTVITPLSATNGRRAWTPADDDVLEQGVRDGKTWKVIAAELGRTVNGIRCRAWFLEIGRE